MPLTGHLSELRTRILRVLVFCIMVFLFCFVKHEGILKLLLSSSNVKAFVFTHPSEAFMTALRLSFFSSLLIAVPLILFEGWTFIRPGLRRVEIRLLQWVAPVSVLLFVFAVGITFVLMPQLLLILQSQAPNWVAPMLSIGRYATFLLKIMLFFGILAQFPICLAIGYAAGLVNSALIKKHRISAWIACYFLAVVVSPPDLLSQICVTLPILACYELLGLIFRAIGR